jgi:hypothetical protein
MVPLRGNKRSEVASGEGLAHGLAAGATADPPEQVGVAR